MTQNRGGVQIKTCPYWHCYAQADWASGIDLTNQPDYAPTNIRAQAIVFIGGNLVVTNKKGVTETIPEAFGGVMGEIASIVASGSTASHAIVYWE